MGPSGWWTWPKPPPSSRRRRRSWVFHGPGSCNLPAWHPSHHSAVPGRGSQCSERPASGSGSYSACLKVMLGWSCVERQKHRSGTECADAPARWQWHAVSGGPRMAALAWGPVRWGPTTLLSKGFSSPSSVQMAAGCWGCLCCSPLPDLGCPSWGKVNVFGFLLGGSSSILAPALLHWHPALLQESWYRTPLLSLYRPPTTFLAPVQGQDAVRLFFTLNLIDSSTNVNWMNFCYKSLLLHQRNLRLLKLHRIGRRCSCPVSELPC